MKKNNFYIFLIIILLVLSTINFIYYFSSQPLEEKTLKTSLIVSNVSGFDLNNSALKFSKVKFGSPSQRKVSIANDYDIPINVFINVEGNISRFISYPRNVSFDINQIKNINLVASIPENLTLGEVYNGKVIFKMYPK
jgi:hypothetical protein